MKHITMKHQLPYYFSLCFVLLLLGAQAGFGQVAVTFTMSPRPSPYLSDWEQRKETAQLNVINSDPYTETVVRIQASVARNGEVVARTKHQSMPILQLRRGQNVFNAETIFPLTAIEFVGSIDRSAQRLGRLPEGNYSICVQLTDIETGAVIADAGCQSFGILDIKPPQPIAPGIPAAQYEDKELTELALVELGELEHPMMSFSWLPPMPMQDNLRYTLRIYPVHAAENPLHVNRRTQPIYEQQTNAPQVFVPLTLVDRGIDPRFLDNGSGLSWNVQATDATGRPVGSNNGMSETFFVPVTGKNDIQSFFDVWTHLEIGHTHGLTLPRYSTVAEFRAGIMKVSSMSAGIRAYLDTLKNGQPNKRGRTEPLPNVASRIIAKLDKGDIAGAVYDVFHFDSKTFSLISYIMKAEMAGDITPKRVTDLVAIIEVPPIPVEGFEPPRIPVAKPNSVQVDTPKCVCKPKVKIRATWSYIAPCGNYSRSSTGYAANNTLNNMSRGTMYTFTPEVSNCPHAGHWTSEVTAPAGGRYGASTGRDGSVTLLSESGGTYKITFTWHCPCGPKVSETFTINFR